MVLYLDNDIDKEEKRNRELPVTGVKKCHEKRWRRSDERLQREVQRVEDRIKQRKSDGFILYGKPKFSKAEIPQSKDQKRFTGKRLLPGKERKE